MMVDPFDGRGRHNRVGWGFWLIARAASAWQLLGHKFHGIGFAKIKDEKGKDVAVNESDYEETNNAQILWLWDCYRIVAVRAGKSLPASHIH
jgi:hypothetical protein